MKTTTMTTSRIIFQNESGGVSVIVPTGSVELALKDVPEGTPYEIVEEADIPSDRTFRGAWVANGDAVDIDLDKAKAIGHDIRRTKREAEFAPFDAIIMKQIPGNSATEAEEARQQIRFKYALIQDVIEAAETPDEIKSALESA
jgi:hypothetical protein